MFFCERAQFAADGVRGKPCAQQAAIQRSDAAFVQRPSQQLDSACEAFSNEGALVRFDGSLGKRGFDMPVGHAASAQVTRDAK